jgi:transcriptional regulator with XRE-family HTH domain
MPRPSAHPHNPLQLIRLTAGKTQQEFADILNVSKSEISKRETSTPGYTTIPTPLVRKLAHEFGVVIDPRPTHKPRVHGLAGETFDPKYVETYRKEREEQDSRLVKYRPADLVGAVAVVAEVCGKLKQEESLARVLEQAVQVLCLSPRLAREIANQLKKIISAPKPEEINAARWLAHVIGQKEMAQGLPTLSTIIEHHKKVEARTPGIKGITKENFDDFVHQQRLKKKPDVI